MVLYGDVQIFAGQLLSSVGDGFDFVYIWSCRSWGLQHWVRGHDLKGEHRGEFCTRYLIVKDYEITLNRLQCN